MLCLTTVHSSKLVGISPPIFRMEGAWDGHISLARSRGVMEVSSSMFHLMPLRISETELSTDSIEALCIRYPHKTWYRGRGRWFPVHVRTIALLMQSMIAQARKSAMDICVEYVGHSKASKSR